MNQLEETLGGWVRFLFVAFTGRVDTCWFGIHEAFAINVATDTARIRAVCDDEHHYRVLRSLPVCWHTANQVFESEQIPHQLR